MEQVERNYGAPNLETPIAVRRVVRELVCAASGEGAVPPRARVRTAWGTISLEALWLAPAGSSAADIVADRGAAQIAVNLELREPAVLHAARVLRASGASPAQVRIGVLLATGRNKPAIARELGVKPSSITDAARKLYARLDVSNAAESGCACGRRMPWNRRLSAGPAETAVIAKFSSEADGPAYGQFRSSRGADGDLREGLTVDH